MTEERNQLTLTLLGLLTDSWAILPPEEWDSGLDPFDAASRDMVALGHDLHLVEPGGDYFWVVQDNQPTLRADIALLFAEPPWGEEMAPAGECGRHGDRWEERTLWTSTALNEHLDWPQVRQVCCVERQVTCKGAISKELAYASTSLSPAQAGPQELLCLWRSHWGIENRLHYVRDVTMKEDASQVRSGSGPTPEPAPGVNSNLELTRL